MNFGDLRFFFGLEPTVQFGPLLKIQWSIWNSSGPKLKVHFCSILSIFLSMFHVLLYSQCYAMFLSHLSFFISTMIVNDTRNTYINLPLSINNYVSDIAMPSVPQVQSNAMSISEPCYSFARSSIASRASSESTLGSFSSSTSSGSCSGCF